MSLSAQVCHAQQAERVKENKGVRIESVKEYKVVYDSIASLVKQAKEDSVCYVGMTISEKKNGNFKEQKTDPSGSNYQPKICP